MFFILDNKEPNNQGSTAFAKNQLPFLFCGAVSFHFTSTQNFPHPSKLIFLTLIP